MIDLRNINDIDVEKFRALLDLRKMGFDDDTLQELWDAGKPEATELTAALKGE